MEKNSIKYSHPTVIGNVIDAITADMLWRTDFNEEIVYHYVLSDKKDEDGMVIKSWKLESFPMEGILENGARLSKSGKSEYQRGETLPAPTQQQVISYLDRKGVYVGAFWSVSHQEYSCRIMPKAKIEKGNDWNYKGIFVEGHKSEDLNTVLELGIQDGIKFLLNNNLAHETKKE